MSFYSTITAKLEGGRFALPAAFRDVLGERAVSTLMVSKSLPGVQSWLDCADWAGGEQRLKAAILRQPFEKREKIQRIYYSRLMKVEIDAKGRFGLPADYLRHAGLEGEVAFVGAGTSFQLWSPAAYEAYLAEELAAFGVEGIGANALPDEAAA